MGGAPQRVAVRLSLQEDPPYGRTSDTCDTFLDPEGVSQLFIPRFFCFNTWHKLSDVSKMNETDWFFGCPQPGVDLLLRLGFAARGQLQVTIRTPADLQVIGHGPTPSGGDGTDGMLK